jgi:hypothetical protein
MINRKLNYCVKIESANDRKINDIVNYMFIDGMNGSYNIGYVPLEDGTIDVEHFLNIDGEEIYPEYFERDYVEFKLMQALNEECKYEFDSESY